MTRDGFHVLISEMAAPEALRENPFLVLDAPIDAPATALRKEAELRRLQSQVSAEGVSGADEERFERALRRLRDPQHRLVYELLWYWPEHADAQTGHNQAIRALESVLAEQGASLVSACGRAILAMEESLNAPATGRYLARRAEALDDPRIAAVDGQHAVEEARRLVPLLALRMGVRAQHRDESSLAAGLAEVVRANTTPTVSQAVVREVVTPMLDAIRTTADAARRKARSDRPRASESAVELLQQTSADRALVDVLIAADDPRRTSMIDEVAQSVLECIAHCYDHHYESGGRDDEVVENSIGTLLEATAALRPSPAIRERIDHSLAMLEEKRRASRRADKAKRDLEDMLDELENEARQGGSAPPGSDPTEATRSTRELLRLLDQLEDYTRQNPHESLDAWGRVQRAVDDLGGQPRSTDRDVAPPANSTPQQRLVAPKGGLRRWLNRRRP